MKKLANCSQFMNTHLLLSLLLLLLLLLILLFIVDKRIQEGTSDDRFSFCLTERW